MCTDAEAEEMHDLDGAYSFWGAVRMQAKTSMSFYGTLRGRARTMERPARTSKVHFQLQRQRSFPSGTLPLQRTVRTAGLGDHDGDGAREQGPHTATQCTAHTVHVLPSLC